MWKYSPLTQIRFSANNLLHRDGESENLVLTGTAAINGGGNSLANTLKLTLSDVLDMANNNIFNTNSGWSNVTGSAVSGQVNQHQLGITGNTNDTLQLRSSEWSNSGATVRDSGGEIYKVYTAQNSAAQLMIDKDILIAVI